MWYSIADDVVTNGIIHSVKGFEYDPDAISRILWCAEQDEIKIGFKGGYVMLFRSGEFVRSEEFFFYPGSPKYASETMLLMWEVGKSLEIFTMTDISREIRRWCGLSKKMAEKGFKKMLLEGYFVEDDDMYTCADITDIMVRE